MKNRVFAQARRVGAATALSLGLVGFLPGVASASFPGENGVIIFQSTRGATAAGCPYSSTSELFVTGPGVSGTAQLDCTGSTDQHPSASPDGSEVAFASNRNDGADFELYTVPLSTTGAASGTPLDVSQDLPSGASDDYPSWAPAASGAQNTLIFQSTREGGLPELFTENLDVPGSVAPVFPPTTTAGFSDTEPVYDPSNANEIAFVRTTGSGPSQIYTYNLSTHVLVDLSAANGDAADDDSKPDFAPGVNADGTQLVAFQSNRPTGGASNGPCAGTQLYTMSDQPEATSTILPVFQQWSGTPPAPTGVQVCTTSQGAEGVGAGTKVAAENPVFSPDGTEIAFDQLGSDGAGSTQNIFTAYEAPFDGSAAQSGNEDDLTPNYATDQAPTWAPILPGASTPEAPATLLLPVSGIAIGGAVLAVRRRRTPVSNPAPASPVP